MNKLIKIVQSPFNPALEVVEDIVIKLHFPYSESSVTVQINPNTQHYKENADTENAKVRQVMMSTTTDQTKTLTFDIEKNRKQNINIEDSNYEIELMNIGKENIEDKEYLFYEFNVTKG